MLFQTSSTSSSVSGVAIPADILSASSNILWIVAVSCVSLPITLLHI